MQDDATMKQRREQLNKALEVIHKDRDRIMTRINAPLRELHDRYLSTMAELEEQGFREAAWVNAFQCLIVEALSESIPQCLDLAIQGYAMSMTEEIQTLPHFDPLPVVPTVPTQCEGVESSLGEEGESERAS